MSFLAADMLWSLVAVPWLAYAYVRLVQARQGNLAALGTMGLGATEPGRRWRRHVPVALFLLALSILCVAAARPVATLELPRREGTVVLAIDVSASMGADDVAPSRIRAAQRAAERFVARQPESIEIGVVAFSTAAFEVVPPTKDRAEVRAAIRRLRPAGATSLARGITAAVNAIAGRPVVTDLGVAPAPPPGRAPADESPADEPRVPFLGSAVIVVVSDGEDTTALDPVAAADVAGRAGVRVVTVGVGSNEGSVVDVDGFQVATHRDEEQLRAIAAAASGQYFPAVDADALADVSETVDLRLAVEPEKTEVTALLAAVALAVLLVAAVLSYRWLGRVP